MLIRSLLESLYPQGINLKTKLTYLIRSHHKHILAQTLRNVRLFLPQAKVSKISKVLKQVPYIQNPEPEIKFWFDALRLTHYELAVNAYDLKYPYQRIFAIRHFIKMLTEIFKVDYESNNPLSESKASLAFSQLIKLPNISRYRLKSHFKYINESDWKIFKNPITITELLDLIENQVYKSTEDKREYCFFIHNIKSKISILLKLSIKESSDDEKIYQGKIYFLKDGSLTLIKHITLTKLKTLLSNNLSIGDSSDVLKIWYYTKGPSKLVPISNEVQSKERCNKFLDKMHNHLWVAIRRKLNKIDPEAARKFAIEASKDSTKDNLHIPGDSNKIWNTTKTIITSQVWNGSLKLETAVDRVNVLNQFVEEYVEWFMDKFNRSQ